jgi:hypothetical protein
MSTLSDNLKPGFFQSAKGLEMIDAGKLRHESKRHFYFSHIRTLQRIRDGGEIILNGSANILQRFILGRSLRPATGQGGATDGVAFIGLDENNGITETH